MANGGNPFVIDRLNEVREQNKDLYDQGKFDLLLDKFNDGFDFKIDNPGLLQEAYNYYDQIPPPIDDSEKKIQKRPHFWEKKIWIRIHNQRKKILHWTCSNVTKKPQNIYSII